LILGAPLFVSLVLLGPGCSEDTVPPEPDCSSVADSTIVPTVSYKNDIEPLFAEEKYSCLEIGCHGGGLHSSNYSLESHAGCVQRGDQAHALGMCQVKPGDPESSYLYWKIEGRQGIIDEPMPNGCRNASDPNECVSDEDLALVRTWILEGAPDN
jgi:hypothetical protein